MTTATTNGSTNGTSVKSRVEKLEADLQTLTWLHAETTHAFRALVIKLALAQLVGQQQQVQQAQSDPQAQLMQLLAGAAPKNPVQPAPSDLQTLLIQRLLAGNNGS